MPITPNLLSLMVCFQKLQKYGTANVKRIYGDWTLSGLKGWQEVLLQYSIQPIPQFGYTSGKNATDSALIIDAMDLLYTGKFDGFCIVSSDSDFTKLASRIREAGLYVYVVSGCDKFIFTEVLRSRDELNEKIRRDTACVVLCRMLQTSGRLDFETPRSPIL